MNTLHRVSHDGIRVLCIGGTGQNGATLLSRLLGGMPQFIAVGELGYVWDWGLIQNRRCGCGTAFRDCLFWERVGEEAFGGWGNVDAQAAVELRGAVKRKGRPLAHPLSLAFLLWPSSRRAHHRSVTRYGDLMERLYQGIHRVSDGRIIVDSMKRPSHVYLTCRIPSIDVRVVHLVRDSRGVAYSGLKWIKRQGGDETFRARRSPRKTALRWMWINASFHLLAALGVPTALVEYERLAVDPETELRRIGALASARVNGEDLDFLRGEQFDLPAAHLVAGNRLRLQSGPVRLRVDDAWRTGLPAGSRREVLLLTWPLLRKYGYVGRSASQNPASEARVIGPAQPGVA